jgi:outer membrane biosynthesis protein TonB
MSRRLSLALAALAALCAFAAPSALAAGKAASHKCDPTPPSAVNVYVEQFPTDCGSTPTKKTHPVKKPTPVQPAVQPPPVNVQTTQTPVVSVKPRTHHKLHRKHHKLHKMHKHNRVVRTVKPAAKQPLRLTRTASRRQPSAVGAAFDLGSGPTALFAALLAAAALLAVGGGFLRRRG